MDSGRTYTDTDIADAAPSTDAAPPPTTQQDTTGTDRAETRDTTPSTDAATPPTTRQDATGTDRAETRDATAHSRIRHTATPTTDDRPARTDAEPRDTTRQHRRRPGTAVNRTRTGTERAGARDATGRRRLRKYVTTETVTRTVPVQREEVRIEREPIAEEDRDEIANRPDSDDEVILHEERVIVTKETVPVERLRIVTETVTDEVTIREKVHKEHFDDEGSQGSEGSEGSEDSRG